MNQLLDDLAELMLQRRLITALMALTTALGILAIMVLIIGFASGKLIWIR